MNKTEALNRLSALENEAKALRAIIEAPEKKLSVIERILTIEDACNELGIDFDDLYDDCEDEYEEAEKAIKTFAKALREGKAASECFYYPYFYRPSGGGFSCSAYDGGHGYTRVGARLCVDTAEKAKHLGKCMEPFYKTYLTGK